MKNSVNISIVLLFVSLIAGCTTSAEQGAAKTLDNANSAIGSVAGKIWVPNSNSQSNEEEEQKKNK